MDKWNFESPSSDGGDIDDEEFHFCSVTPSSPSFCDEASGTSVVCIDELAYSKEVCFILGTAWKCGTRKESPAATVRCSDKIVQRNTKL
jgi:hypothetical protein